MDTTDTVDTMDTVDFMEAMNFMGAKDPEEFGEGGRVGVVAFGKSLHQADKVSIVIRQSVGPFWSL